MKKYFVYILICSDKSYYVGMTNDVFLREEQHNQGLYKKAYTFQRRPVKLVWYQEFENPNEAIAREKQLKGWTREKKEALINDNLEALPELSMNHLRRAQNEGGLRQAQTDSSKESGLRQAQTDNAKGDSLRQAQTDSGEEDSLRRAQTDSTVDGELLENQTDRYKSILDKLPYTKPFLFVDSIAEINESRVVGSYTFNADADFYKGHFTNFPVTPGVLLTECCAQIGLVCLGIYLLGENASADSKIGLASSDMEFLAPVLPNETVKVQSELVYFRFSKLKCKVKMYNANGELVCKGVLAGMLKA